MISMSQVTIIRQKYKNGMPIGEICREEKVDYKTAKKYIEQEDFSEKLPVKKQKIKKIDDYAAEIEQMLSENQKLWRKQRLTSKRVFDLLKEKHADFSVSYDCVNRFVQKWKKERKNSSEQGFSHLIWHAGEAQADFGEADIEHFGSILRIKYFVLSFPQSNVAYMQLFSGENCECVCQGLMDIFEYIGGVPFKIVFDNATGIGRVICKVLEENEMFTRFKLHYGFESRFCNPYSGHEKGSVEKNVGFLRSNILTPVIKVTESLENFNKNQLFGLCQKLMDKRIHYIHKVPVMTLFEADKKALFELPAKKFEARKIHTLKTDNYSNVTLEGIHKYTLPAEYRNCQVLVETWAWKVMIYDMTGKKIEEYERIYGRKHSESINPALGIVNLSRKPGMWNNSRFRENLPADNPFRLYVDSINEAEIKHKIFVQFHNALERHPFETVLKSFSEMAKMKTDMTVQSNVLAVCSRIASCPVDFSYNPTGVDLNKYANLIKTEEPSYECC